MATRRKLYRIIFLNQGKVYEIYASSVSQGALFGFIQVEGLLFGQRSEVVVDPSEETLKREFAGVTRFSVPLHAVFRVDEVEKQGVSRITDSARGTAAVTPFPSPIPTKP